MNILLLKGNSFFYFFFTFFFLFFSSFFNYLNYFRLGHLITIENINDPHDQKFLRAHDMPVNNSLHILLLSFHSSL